MQKRIVRPEALRSQIRSIGNARTESKLSAITDKQRNSGEFRAGSKQQKGQRVAADYYMEPSIIIDNSSTGRMAGALGGRLGVGGALLAAGMESKVSVTAACHLASAKRISGHLVGSCSASARSGTASQVVCAPSSTR